MKIFKYLLMVSIILVGCSKILAPNHEFEANIKLRSLLNGDNIEDTRIKADIYDNEIGVEYGSVVWIDFKKEIDKNYIVDIPSSSDIVGVVLETTQSDSVFNFIGWKSETTINFERTFSYD